MGGRFGFRDIFDRSRGHMAGAFSAGIIAIAASSLISGCARAPAERKITFKVTGDEDWAKAHPKDDHFAQQFVKIRMRNASGGSDEFLAEVPWSKDDTVKDGDLISLSAQLDRDDEYIIGCELYLDGNLVKQSHSSGRYAIADCDGRI